MSEEYKIINTIGTGYNLYYYRAFGNAYLARHLIENTDYVIKKIHLSDKNKN